jgi:hypothetical protein
LGSALAGARAGLTLAALALLFVPWLPGGWIAAFVLALGGDAVDRCQYYMELERETPRRQMDLALARRLAAREGAHTRFKPVAGILTTHGS